MSSSLLPLTACLLSISVSLPALALPPPEDRPEEVLRTEIVTAARSPVDGKPLTASEYAELQAQLETAAFATQIDPKIRHLILLLRVRKLLRPIIPF